MKTPNKKNYDLIIIGAGPGGYTAAVHASILGMQVACIEKENNLGGVCLNRGCIPSKALLESSERFWQVQHDFKQHGIEIEKVKLDFKQMMTRKDQVVTQLNQGIAGLFKKYKIDHYLGAASFTDDKQLFVKNEKSEEILTAKNYLIATGSQSRDLPHIKVDQKSILDSTGVLNLKKVPKKMVVLGAGYIGLELGSVYLRLGAEVVVVEMMDHILPGMDSEMAQGLKVILEKQGMQFKFSSRVESVDLQKTGKLKLSLKAENSFESLLTDVLLVSIGRKPLIAGLELERVGVGLTEQGFIKVNEKYQTDCPGIYAVGDVIGNPMLAHKASAEGIAAVEIMAGQAGQVNYQVIPSVVYTSPEMAGVGLSEQDLQKMNIDYRKSKYFFKANGRALAMGETQGWIKLLCHAQTDRVLGAYIMGPQTSQLISEISLAVEFGASSEDLARVIHPHPSLSEVIPEAAWNLQY